MWAGPVGERAGRWMGALQGSDSHTSARNKGRLCPESLRTKSFKRFWFPVITVGALSFRAFPSMRIDCRTDGVSRIGCSGMFVQ